MKTTTERILVIVLLAYFIISAIGIFGERKHKKELYLITKERDSLQIEINKRILDKMKSNP